MGLVKNLKLYFESNLLLDIEEWNLAEDRITYLMGPSGSGKSTLLKILLGLYPCPGASFQFAGKEMMSLTPSERNFGVVFQNYGLFPHMTAEQNILFALEARNQKVDSASQQQLQLLISRLGLQKCLKQPVPSLSGGEQQRVALARCLITRPQMIFLDEPFSALDSELKAESRQVVGETLKSLQIPALIVSHDPEDALVLPGDSYHLKDRRPELR